MWTFFHKMGSPRWYYQISGQWLPWIAIVTVSLLVVGSIWGLAIAPMDFRQGNSYRIIYIHVPSVFVAMSGYMVMAIAAAITLIWKTRKVLESP